MVILVFLGPPGAGKGTQAKKLAKERGYAHVSTGEMLRLAVAAGTELGLKVKPILEAGHYVSDDLMIALIEERLKMSDCARGVILDGFPTTPQAEALDALHERAGSGVSQVIYFDVDESGVRARLENRRQGEARADDDPEVQLKRIRVYQEQTLPLVNYYEERKNIFRVDGSGDIEAVYRLLNGVLTDAR